MAFTKIAAAGIGSTGTVTLENIVVTGDLNASSITGAASTANVKTDSLIVSGVTTSSGGFSGTNANITGLSTFSGGILVGDSFIRPNAVGLGTTDTSGRNAGVGTATGTIIFNSSTNAVQVYKDRKSVV
jgi:hypothetical protein